MSRSSSSCRGVYPSIILSKIACLSSAVFVGKSTTSTFSSSSNLNLPRRTRPLMNCNSWNQTAKSGHWWINPFISIFISDSTWYQGDKPRSTTRPGDSLYWTPAVLPTWWRLNFWRFRNFERRQPWRPARGVWGHPPEIFSKIDIKICIFMPFAGDLDWIWKYHSESRIFTILGDFREILGIIPEILGIIREGGNCLNIWETRDWFENDSGGLATLHQVPMRGTWLKKKISEGPPKWHKSNQKCTPL